MIFALASLWIAQNAIAASTGQTGTDPGFRAHNACQDSERWSYSKNLSDSWQDEFEGFLSKKKSAVRGFSQALALRRQSGTYANESMRIFGEYWISRALIEGKMADIAFGGFSLIASYPTTAEIAPIQIAALECLNRIQLKYPGFELGDNVIKRIPEIAMLATSPDEREAVGSALVWAVKIEVSKPAFSESKVKAHLASLSAKELGAYSNWGHALVSSRLSRHADTNRELTQWLTLAPTSPNLTKHLDQVYLLKARALFAMGQYHEAEEALKKIKKSSNELAKALSELSWSYLMDEKYGEAIGTSLGFLAGGLRHTFAPEAPMVAAMALNEICQYPESIKAINTFKKNYEKPFKWLDSWQKNQTPLYGAAVEFLQKKGDVPARVGTEWVRSPLFLSYQGRINLLIDEKDFATALGKQGAKEQRKLAADILVHWKELKGRIQAMRAKSKTRIELPAPLIAELVGLKKQITAFRRLYHAAPAWQNVLANHEAKVASMKRNFVNWINDDLRKRTLAMHSTITEIAENNQLVEVEIYNGASQDIIWQNAHPEYKDLAKKIKEQSETKEHEHVWDWGRSTASADDEDAEIWEDELGSFKADLVDNCSSKEKFLALKRIR